jgi:hypothetical protein
MADTTGAVRYRCNLNCDRAIFWFINPTFRARSIADTHLNQCQQPVLQISCSGHVNSDSRLENKLA